MKRDNFNFVMLTLRKRISKLLVSSGEQCYYNVDTFTFSKRTGGELIEEVGHRRNLGQDIVKAFHKEGMKLREVEYPRGAHYTVAKFKYEPKGWDYGDTWRCEAEALIMAVDDDNYALVVRYS